MNTQDAEVFDFLRRRASTTTEVVVERDCPPCPPCPECDEDKIITVDTLKIKNDGNVIVKPVNNNTDWIFGDDCEIHTPQEVTQAKYAITSLYNIEPSHIPPSFSANPKYPKGCNERDYQKDNQEQGKVIKYANVFNPKFLINDDNTPANGAIICDENGIVLGGNGRTMTLHLVVSEFQEKFLNYERIFLKFQEKLLNKQYLTELLFGSKTILIKNMLGRNKWDY